MHRSKYSWTQYGVIALFSFTLLLSGMIYSLQAPFYPREAENKGIPASQYGFVFGVFELVSFFASLCGGTAVSMMGPKTMLLMGLLLAGCSCLVFGWLPWVSTASLFLAYSFICRIIEALGQTGTNIAIMSAAPGIFPHSSGSVLAFVEAFYGVGLMLGPFVGGVLDDLAGFLCPFTTVGCLLILSMVPTLMFIPNDSSLKNQTESSSISYMRVLSIPSIWLGIVTLISAVVCTGDLQVTLQPYLKDFQLSSTKLGSLFLLQGMGYAVTCPIWGRLSEKCINPTTSMMIGAFLICLGLSFIGPLPVLPWDKTLWAVIVGILSVGVGIGAQYVPALIHMKQACVSDGLEDSLKTHGFVSGLWLSSLTLGGFIGPSFGGIMYDTIGFRWTTVLLIGIIMIIFMFTVIYECRKKPDKVPLVINPLSENERLLEPTVRTHTLS